MPPVERPDELHPALCGGEPEGPGHSRLPPGDTGHQGEDRGQQCHSAPRPQAQPDPLELYLHVGAVTELVEGLHHLELGVGQGWAGEEAPEELCPLVGREAGEVLLQAGLTAWGTGWLLDDT